MLVLIPLLAMTSAGTGCHEVSLPELNLKLAFPELEDFQTLERRDEAGSWKGKLGAHDLDVGVLVFEDTSFWLEPGYVTEHVVDFLRRQTDFDVIAASHLQGPFGYATYASLVEGTLPAQGGRPEGVQFLLGGLLEGKGYLLYVECRPVPDDPTRAAIATFLERGIAYDGPVRDPSWADEEVLARWLRDTPEDLHADFEQSMKKSSQRKKVLVRTEHYLIMGNSSGAKSFAKKIEDNYDQIRKIFPFPEIEGRRLMPIFLFRTPDQYYDYYVKIANTTHESAEKSKGHAWRDYYATWYEAPRDPVHIHEMTHQVFSNRLHLGGGGSWFQEGVAEYIETSENDRNEAARRVKKQEHVKLREFVGLPSLLGSSQENVRGQGGAGDAYKQAALLIEFLRESSFGKDKFESFLRTMGKVPRGDVKKIEAAFRAVYGQGLEEVEAEWVEYCSKR